MSTYQVLQAFLRLVPCNYCSQGGLKHDLVSIGRQLRNNPAVPVHVCDRDRDQ